MGREHDDQEDSLNSCERTNPCQCHMAGRLGSALAEVLIVSSWRERIHSIISSVLWWCAKKRKIYSYSYIIVCGTTDSRADTPMTMMMTMMVKKKRQSSWIMRKLTLNDVQSTLIRSSSSSVALFDTNNNSNKTITICLCRVIDTTSTWQSWHSVAADPPQHLWNDN